jgi:hypothetical protein
VVGRVGTCSATPPAERRYRELPPGSPEAADALEGVNALWEAYERALGKALGRGALRPPEPKR